MGLQPHGVRASFQREYPVLVRKTSSSERAGMRMVKGSAGSMNLTEPASSRSGPGCAMPGGWKRRALLHGTFLGLLSGLGCAPGF